MSWTKVQSPASTGFGTDPQTKAFASNVTVGDLVVAVYSYAFISAPGGAITFSKSAGTATIGTFSTIAFVEDSTNGQGLAIGRCVVTGTGSLTVQGSSGLATAFNDLGITEWSGNDAAGATDGSTARNVTSTTPSTANITTTTNGDLLFAAAEDTSGAGTITAGTGYTEAIAQGGANLLEVEYQVQTSAGAVNAAWANTASDANNVVLVAFKPAAAAGDTLFGQAVM